MEVTSEKKVIITTIKLNEDEVQNLRVVLKYAAISSAPGGYIDNFRRELFDRLS